MPDGSRWDTELYEAQHSFVWQLGQGLVEQLAPLPGERILDAGCGTGHLTAEIAKRGADTLGLDSSPEMIGQARQHFPPAAHPNLRFLLADAAAMPFHGEFNGVFSNAALHWMPDTAAVARSMFAALQPGGRLVLECGGRGNIGRIEAAIEAVFANLLHLPLPASRTIFHSIASFSAIFEAVGFEIRSALLFDRPTMLTGDQGMERWLLQFEAYRFEHLPSALRAQAVAAVVDRLRSELYRDGAWYADYRRLRVLAYKS